MARRSERTEAPEILARELTADVVDGEAEVRRREAKRNPEVIERTFDGFAALSERRDEAFRSSDDP